MTCEFAPKHGKMKNAIRVDLSRQIKKSNNNKHASRILANLDAL
jgi:hypothetical protein